MANVILTPEEFCREFAAKVPTPNVLQAIKYAEDGLVTWQQVTELFSRALKAADGFTTEVSE